MRINEFFYWLQGYFEISGTADILTSEQCTLILRHLDLVDVGNGGSPDAARLGKMRTLFDLAVEGTLPRGTAAGHCDGEDPQRGARSVRARHRPRRGRPRGAGQTQRHSQRAGHGLRPWQALLISHNRVAATPPTPKTPKLAPPR